MVRLSESQTHSTQTPRSPDSQELHAAGVWTAYLDLLERGASPAGACLELGISREAVRQALEADAAFRDRVHDVNAILSENVRTALYRAAMQGNVTAMSFWLKTSPPPGWGLLGEAGDETTVPMTFDEVLNGLTYDELRQLGGSVDCHLPDQSA